MNTYRIHHTMLLFAIAAMFIPTHPVTALATVENAAFDSRRNAVPAVKSGPGKKVFSSVHYLWKIAPEKFRPLLAEEDWKRHTLRYTMKKKGFEKVVLDYDVAEFGDERARMSESKNGPPDYVVTATKHFDSDAACLAYYKALLDGFDVLLAPDKVKRSERGDHVFFKDKRKAWERKLYVKHHVKQKGRKDARIVLSVRSTMLKQQ